MFYLLVNHQQHTKFLIAKICISFTLKKIKSTLWNEKLQCHHHYLTVIVRVTLFFHKMHHVAYRQSYSGTRNCKAILQFGHWLGTLNFEATNYLGSQSPAVTSGDRGAREIPPLDRTAHPNPLIFIVSPPSFCKISVTVQWPHPCWHYRLITASPCSIK